MEKKEETKEPVSVMAGEERKRGVISVIGIGPGAYEKMTIEAARLLEESDVIIGYTVYVDLIKAHFPDRKYLTTPMRGEAERCRLAFEEARKGSRTALVCSGDAGIYGLAGLMYEIGREYPDIQVKIVPGVTAAVGCAAVLGAPLINDFCVISLSDILTPSEDIVKRLEAAAAADFVIVLYNPSSHRRQGYLEKACRIILRFRSPETVCGLVRNAGREGESSDILTLGELEHTEADMFTTVFIGSTKTGIISGRMVTPRGYRNV